MPIYMIGGGNYGPPFSRAFFSTRLGDILDKGGKKNSHKLKIFLTDGGILDICKIEDLEDEYMLVRDYASDEKSCELTLDIIPYGLIYRVQISPQVQNDERVGFNWTPPPVKKTTT